MSDLVTLLTVFVLAIFVGIEIITKVPPTLHTPLMSMTMMAEIGAAALTCASTWAGGNDARPSSTISNLSAPRPITGTPFASRTVTRTRAWGN